MKTNREWTRIKSYQIRAAILDGLYKPGDRLLEAELAAAFHVSRSPVREACKRRFWDIIFENAERPILWEMFQKLDDRMTRYYPLLLKELYPMSGSRRRQHEALIEWYRKGRFAEALRAFKKIYLEIVDRIVDHLEAQNPEKSVE